MTMYEIFNKRSAKFAHLFDKKQNLLKSQKREIVRIIEDSSFNSSQFDWSQIESIKSKEYGVIVEKITFKDSNFFFIFDVQPEVINIDMLSQIPERIDFLPYALFSPGKETLKEQSYSETWELQKENFKSWLMYLRIETTEDDTIDENREIEKERNPQVMSKENELVQPRIFIGSSVEGLKIAEAISASLDYNAEVELWNHVFPLGSNTLETLVAVANNYDFAIFVFSPDDIAEIRKEKYLVARDNVIFEMGLFVGTIGKERVYFVIPRNENNLHLPSDLQGITHGSFDPTKANIRSALVDYCSQVKERIGFLGVRNKQDLKKKL